MASDPRETRQQLFDVLVSQLSEFVIVLADREGRFISWHPGVEVQLGYSREEFVGKPAEMLLTEGDRARGVGKAELETAAEKGRASDTHWLVKKGGEQVLVEGVTLGLSHNGEVIGFGKVLRDITEQKIAGENLRALAEALDQAAIIVRSWDGTIDHWTAGCEQLYGWSAEEAIGYNSHELLQTKYPVPLEQIHKQLLTSGRWEGEVEHFSRNGTKLAVATHWVVISDDMQPPRTVIETQTDVTSRVLMQQEIENANERLRSMALELERSNQELEEFARIASHDLSAPITSTRWLIDLLAARHSSQLSEEGRKILAQAAQSLERMGLLVEGILAHAQVGQSAIGSSESIPANDALMIALDNLRRDIDTSGAKITAGELPEVAVDPHALTRLFQNLLSNAIKYRRPGVPPEIRITASHNPDGMWLFEVKDNGMGIEPEWFERIFMPLQRKHGREISGSGIGLATCKKIVTRAGGRIWVESRLGEGSRFCFTLPGPVPAQTQ
jgi:PAS domain S-box-containing protein